MKIVNASMLVFTSLFSASLLLALTINHRRVKMTLERNVHFFVMSASLKDAVQKVIENTEKNVEVSPSMNDFPSVRVLRYSTVVLYRRRGRVRTESTRAVQCYSPLYHFDVLARTVPYRMYSIIPASLLQTVS